MKKPRTTNSKPLCQIVPKSQVDADCTRCEAISERGGVLGAMDIMYQRGKIQEESMYYEHKKHDGSLSLVGVNTFLPKEHAGGDCDGDRADQVDRGREGVADCQR